MEEGEFTVIDAKGFNKEALKDVTVLIIDDEKNLVKSIQRQMRRYKVESLAAYSGEEGIKILEDNSVDVVLCDIKMPGINGIETLKIIKERWPNIPVIMMTAFATIELAVEAMKKGAMDFISKPFEHNEIVPVMLSKAIEQNRLLWKYEHLQREVENRYRFENIVGQSPDLKKIFRTIDRLANNESIVLISGESGTGKELIARAIHYNSSRCKMPFVAIDLGALTENVIESELFGHVKGSFTGAISDHKGLFRIADGGTVFLDEIGEIPLHTQARLLRVLQEKEVKPVGSDKSVKVNVRVLAATNKDLKNMVQKGTFREDLYYRLNVVPIVVQPLRKRKEDVPLLLQHFIKKHAPEKEISLSFTAKAMDTLCAYSWPGNVRELENVIQRLLAVGDLSKPVEVSDLPEEIRTLDYEKPDLNLNSYEKLALQRALDETDDDIDKAAEILCVGKSTFYRKMKLHGIKTPKKKSRPVSLT